ncbi:MAG: hypothetical protein WB588_07120 [Dehalococcoidia bacterium]|jgi:hypothetical protein
MAVKKSVATKKAAPKKVATKKKAVAVKKSAVKTSRGDSYMCGVCGLLVTVDETCGCADVCDIICCGKPMKVKKAKVAAKKK